MCRLHNENRSTFFYSGYTRNVLGFHFTGKVIRFAAKVLRRPIVTALFIIISNNEFPFLEALYHTVMRERL